MAIDSYMFFLPYATAKGGAVPLKAESQVTGKAFSSDDHLAQEDMAKYADQGQLFEIDEYSFDIEQTLNIGSQSSGAGAGKVSFNPFSITRKIDRASTTFFNMACSGQAFQQVGLGIRRASGGSTVAGSIFVRFDFKLVAVKTVAWAHGDESPTETVTFEYGGLIVRYAQQDPSGKPMAVIGGGWNRVTNIYDDTPTSYIEVHK